MLLLAAPVVGQQDLIVDIKVHGNRRIPAETVKARIFSKVGDVYDTAAIERDFNALWNTGYFEDIRFEREQSPKGWILHIYLKERPTIREINYTGLNAVSTSDVLDRFKDRKVGLSVENQYDPTKDQEGRSYAETTALRARASVRHDSHRGAADSAQCRRHHVRGSRRAEG